MVAASGCWKPRSLDAGEDGSPTRSYPPVEARHRRATGGEPDAPDRPVPGRGWAARPGRRVRERAGGGGAAGPAAPPRPPGPPAKDMAWVPGGSFLMGSEDFYPEERPLHRGEGDGFWVGAHPATHAGFRRFFKATGRRAVAERPPEAVDYPDADPTLL